MAGDLGQKAKEIGEELREKVKIGSEKIREKGRDATE